MKALAPVLLAMMVMSSCSDDCQTCTDMTAPSPISTEWCDDGSTNFTDEDGNVITYDEFIATVEEQGQVCE